MGKLRLAIFGISPEEGRFDRRGFPPAAPALQARLEGIGATFVKGYRAALLHDDLDRLVGELEAFDPESRGFAYEGAAMGVWVSDFLTPWRRRFPAFAQGAGNRHLYMLVIGAGWAVARLPQSLEGAMRRLDDPLLGWLMADGLGFHEGYFHWKKAIGECRSPNLEGYAARAFDQGLGRCLWFVKGADPARLGPAIAAFPEHRRADLWSGVGLAATYAGGPDQAVLNTLRTLAGHYRPELAQGSAFAAKARLRAGNPTEHTAMACPVLTGMDMAAAADLTDRMLTDLPNDAGLPAYEVWRQRIQAHFRE